MREAIVLAGGKGTRLRSVVTDIPKPMALVNGRPFLEYILDHLHSQTVGRVILAVNYKSEIIRNHFRNMYRGMRIEYSLETEPLLTGGAIKQALEQCEMSEVFVLNGDTYFAVDFEEMQQFHRDKQADITLAKKWMEDCSRYGTLDCNGDRVVQFNEKCSGSKGYINGGVYLMKKTALDCIKEKFFSFEKDILEKFIGQLYAYDSSKYFIDIGVPEDYYRAQSDFQYMR